MKCYIEIDNGLYNHFEGIEEKHFVRITTGVTSLCYCSKDMINFLAPYIKTERYGKRDIHFKNSRQIGQLIHQYCNFKIVMKNYFENKIYGDCYAGLTKEKYLKIKYAIPFQSINDFLFTSYISYTPYDEYKLLKHYITTHYKSKIDISEEFYNDLINISEFVLNQIKGKKVHYNREVITTLYLKRTNDIICDSIIGDIDIIDENCIYDIKCTSTDNKYKSIMQVLIYLCMKCRKDFFLQNDIKQVKIINPILNVVHTIDIDEFGLDNILKFFKMVFSDYLENHNVEIIGGSINE